MAQISINKKRILIGSFTNKEDAVRAYNKAALKYHGEFAYLNIVESQKGQVIDVQA